MDNDKKIIGFIGNVKLDSDLTNKILSNGYIIVSILDIVNGIFEALYKGEVNNKDFMIVSVRERGYLLNKKFWINLTLSKINKNHNKICILNMTDDDRINGLIKTYNVNDDNVKEIVENHLVGN